MTSIDKINQVPPCVEMWIDFEKILNGVTVKGVHMGALFEHWTNPESRYTQTLQIIQLGANGRDRPALKTLRWW